MSISMIDEWYECKVTKKVLMKDGKKGPIM